ncbi:MAG: ATP-binding protein [bacterium]
MWRYRWALLVVALALPLTLYAITVSVASVGMVFPSFLLLSDGVIPTVGGIEWPPDRGAVSHAQVVAVDGQAVATSGDIYAAVASRAPGALVTYQLRRGDESRALTLPTRRFGWSDYAQTFGVLLLFGVAWLVCGVTVAVLQPGTRQARVFLLQSAIAGLYPITAVFLYRPGFVWLGRACVILECLLGATWIHLALVFPVERAVDGWRRWLVWACYAVGLVLGVAVVVGLSRTPPHLAPLYAEYSFAALGLAVFVAALVVGYRQNPGGSVRPRIKALLPGALLAAGLAGFALINNVVAGRDFPEQFGLLLSPLFSAAVAYAIAKHDLFDVDRVVRQSFVYALLTLTITAVYAASLALISRALPASGQLTAVFSMVFIAGLAFALEPLRRGIQRIVDRAFFRTRLNYRRTVAEVGDTMTTLLHRDEVVAELTRVGLDIMQLESMHVALFDADAAVSLLTQRSGGPVESQPAPACLGELCRRVAGIGAPALAADAAAVMPTAGDGAAVADLLAGLGANVVLPLTFQRRAIGALLLGRRRSGRMLSSDDLALLRTLASQAAIALQNAGSYQALETLTRQLDSKVQQRTAELHTSNEQLSQAYDELKQAQSQIVQSEKMASLGQLVAGVAHELNNPASFIHGGLQNLARYLARLIDLLQVYERVTIADPRAAGEIAEARHAARLDALLRETPALLRICGEGSERIKKIVEDLRVFVRADQGDRVPVDIADGIEQTLRLLADRIERGAVRIHRDYQPVPRLAAQSGQLNQVWMNILANALDAVEGMNNPSIYIALRHEVGQGAAAASDPAPASLVVDIRDNGTGMSPEARAKAFEPFFTTKPIGHGTGLGLSIAFGAVKSHGGVIEIDSAPGSGTTVRVILPLG